MAISLRGSATGLTGGTTTGLAFTLPTGHTANDLLVAVVGVKPYTLSVSSGTLTTDGWTQRSQGANGTTANGLDAGSVWASVWTKVHDGSESNPTGTLSATASPRMSGMIAFQSTLTGSDWSLASTNGSDTAEASTTLDVTGAADPGFSAGDDVLVLVVHNTDAATHTSPSLTIAGCTVANLTQRLGTTTTNQGNDGAMFLYTADITAGTSSAAPQFTATTPTGDSDAQVIFLRIREPQNRAGTVTGDAPATSGTVVGTKSQSQNITGSVVGEAPATTGVVTGSSQRAGVVSGEASVSGTVVAQERHTGTVTGDATVTATVAGVADRFGAVTGDATGSGTASGVSGRFGAVTGEASVSGVIVAGEHHDGTVTGEVTVTGSIAGTANQPGQNFNGTVTGAVAVSGTADGSKAGSGTVTGEASVTGVIGPAPAPTPQPTPGGGGRLIELTRPRPERKLRPIQRRSGRVTAAVVGSCTIVGALGHHGSATGTARPVGAIRGTHGYRGSALADVTEPEVRITGAPTAPRDLEYLALYAELRRTRDDHDLLLLL